MVVTVCYGRIYSAAAHSQAGNHLDALNDAEKALELDPNFTKAYSRLGHAHFCLESYDESVEAYKKALAADPGNATIKASLATAEAKLEASKTISSSGASAVDQEKAASPMDDAGLPNLGGMDLGSMLNNPALMNMASSMMSNPAFSSMLQNPQIAQMAQQMMQDPNALQNMMSNPEIAKLASSMMGGKKK